MSIFSNALKGSRLRYLNLSDIALSEKGVRAFKELLNSQEDLEELYLMNNGLLGKAARILSEFIPSTEKLTFSIFTIVGLVMKVPCQLLRWLSALPI